jgi:hypothetical protein
MQERTRNYSIRPVAVLEINGILPTRAHAWEGTARQLLQMLIDLDIVCPETERLEMTVLADHDTAEQLAFCLLDEPTLHYAAKTRLNDYVSILKFLCRENDKQHQYYGGINRRWLNASLAIAKDARMIARRRMVAAGGGKAFY